MAAALLISPAFLSTQSSLAAPAGSVWNNDRTMMTPAETQTCLVITVYGLASASSLLIGYLAWRKLRPHRRRYNYHQDRGGHRKGLWGWE